MEERVLLNTLDDGVRTLTLNRPDRRNALSGELVRALMEAFTDVRGDAETRVVVLTGSGDRSFCSGADLNPMAAAGGPLAMHEERRTFVRLLQAMRACGRPVIARVGGHVAAGGMGLLVACDLAVAADDVHFSTPEVNVGLFPMMIMTLIRRLIGPRRTLELLLTAQRLPAKTAAEWGLVNHAVPRGELDTSVNDLARRLAGLSPAVLRLGRDAFYRMEDMTVDDALEYLCGQLTLNTLTEDAAEGVMAFVQKRAPEWKGR
ncbi:MAG: crotonase [Deltaproteobacteria bacterium]|nr:MAG: crotonase [Deltaproteobacteria bacterium]